MSEEVKIAPLRKSEASEAKKKVEVPKNARYMRDKDREMVRGIFRFYESPGFTLSFCYRKYKEDRTERYDLTDGEVYSIPLGVAKHLNTNGWHPVHTYATDEKGNKVQKVGHKVHRFGFQSLEFVDIDELSPTKQIVTVENMPLIK